MKRKLCAILVAMLVACSGMTVLAGCSFGGEETESAAMEEITGETVEIDENAVQITLSDSGVTVSDESAGVTTANDIVYYPTGKDFTFGEGTDDDTHTAKEADAHTVVHITKAGTYRISGKLSAGQIAVDLGEDAKTDPDAVVTLVLDNVDITCTVAPAIIFYNVYECGTTENPTAIVDTSAAGANVIIADGTENYVTGSYVARIYKDGTQEYNEDKTEVVDAKKLHKYDGAFYSKMSMNVTGNTGILYIDAENEGLDSEMHLTINGGIIHIEAGNDGINTNEDGVSVTTINGGKLTVTVTGETGEGDGIDSNGWIVINGGIVQSSACATSNDSGLDSDMGIYINGGTVAAAGNMLDQIAESDGTHMVFTFTEQQSGGAVYYLKNASGETVISYTPENSFRYLVFSSDKLTEGTYTLWCGNKQLEGTTTNGAMGGGMGGMMLPDGTAPTKPEDGTMPEMPEGMTPPDGEAATKPEEKTDVDKMGSDRTNVVPMATELTDEFPVTAGSNYYQIGTMEGMEIGGGMHSGEKTKEFPVNQGGNYYSI